MTLEELREALRDLYRTPGGADPEGRADLLAALARLVPSEWTAIMGRAAGYTYAELTDFLGVHATTVVRRAERRLLKELNQA